VFNAIHGVPGESGEFIAYLELMNIKHTSAPFYQMALTCNKRDCLSVVSKQQVPIAQSIYLNLGDNLDLDKIEQDLDYPFFVKPNRSGSSYGISKVHNREELIIGIENAFKEDKEILLEAFLDGTEVSIGVISTLDGPLALPITEIVSENDFFDYEAKYLGKSQEITPARINNQLTEELSRIAMNLYRTLGMKGFSRSEFIIVDDIPHFIEMNTVPGLTAESILPQQARAANIDLEELFTLAIEQA
jgi:D-alanine-D-alanine ligase